MRSKLKLFLVALIILTGSLFLYRKQFFTDVVPVPDPITRDTIMKILSSDYKDFPLLGLKPSNPGYSLSQKVFGISIGTTFENMKDFRKKSAL